MEIPAVASCSSVELAIASTVHDQDGGIVTATGIGRWIAVGAFDAAWSQQQSRELFSADVAIWRSSLGIVIIDLNHFRSGMAGVVEGISQTGHQESVVDAVEAHRCAWRSYNASPRAQGWVEVGVATPLDIGVPVDDCGFFGSVLISRVT